MSHQLTRDALHALVWAQPMQKLAKEFGLSDRGLAKICAAADIPVPARGYWAKLQAGHKVSPCPLPPRGFGQARIDHLLRQASAFHQAAQIRAYVALVRETNDKAPDPMTAQALDEWANWALAQAARIDPVVSGAYKTRPVEPAEGAAPLRV